MVPTIEHHGRHSRTPANQRQDQAPVRNQRQNCVSFLWTLVWRNQLVWFTCTVQVITLRDIEISVAEWGSAPRTPSFCYAGSKPRCWFFSWFWFSFSFIMCTRFLISLSKRFNIGLLISVFHIGLVIASRSVVLAWGEVIASRSVVLAWGEAEGQYNRPRRNN